MPMKYDIARAESAKVKIVSSEKGSRLIQLEINPKSSFVAVDLDHKEEKLSEVSTEQFEQRSKLEQLKVIGIEHDDFAAAFKVKEAEFLDNGNLALNVKLIQKPDHKNKKWNRADHIGKSFTDKHIEELSKLPKKFVSNAIFDFEGFKDAKEHVDSLQAIDRYHQYSNVNSSPIPQKRISEDKQPQPNSNPPAYFSDNTGFANWYSGFTSDPNAYIGSPWLVNTDLNQNSPFFQATGYTDPTDVIQNNYWPWRNVWGILKIENGTLFDLNKELQLDVITEQIWEKTLPLGDGINLDLSLDLDIMPGAQLFAPAGLWDKLHIDDWAAAAGLSLRPRATAKLSGFENGSYNLTFENTNFQLVSDSVECGEGITCGISGGIDVEVDGVIDVTGGDLELEVGVQGGVVGRLGGIYNFDKSFGGAVGFSQTGFNDSITGGSLKVLISPEISFDVGVGVPESFASWLDGWLGDGSIAELVTTLSVPLTTEFDLSNIDSGIPVSIDGFVELSPSLKILPGTIVETDISLGGPFSLLNENYSTVI